MRSHAPHSHATHSHALHSHAPLSSFRSAALLTASRLKSPATLTWESSGPMLGHCLAAVWPQVDDAFLRAWCIEEAALKGVMPTISLRTTRDGDSLEDYAATQLQATIRGRQLRDAMQREKSPSADIVEHV